MKKNFPKTPADLITSLSWGSHCCNFFDEKTDLLDILAPYFKTGLLSNEFCLWVTSKPVNVEDAIRAMRKILPKFDAYLARGQIEIHPHDEWYLKGGIFRSRRVLNRWIDKYDQALAQGYDGMRLTGNAFRLEKASWKKFADYEAELDKTIGPRRIKALCTYSLELCRANEIIDVINNHGYALIKRGDWELIENAQRKRAEERALQKALAEVENRVQLRTAELKDANQRLLCEIAERTQAQQALRQAQARTESVLESVADTHILFDRRWRYLYVNGAALRGIGRPREQILGHTLWELYPDIAGTESEGQYRRAMDERIPVAFDFHYLTLDTWWANRFYPVPEGLAVFASDITERKRAEEALRKSQTQLRALAAYLQSVREEERTHIARELHDEIGQALTAIKLSLERKEHHAPDRVSDGVAQAVQLANELIGRVRDLSLDLRPAMLDDLGLLAGLTWHFDRYNTQFKIDVDFQHSGLEGQRFEPEIETAAYRIVQEALTNVARHAAIDKVEVEVRVDENMLRIRVQDTGAGFDPNSLSVNTSGGLSGMHERAMMLRGRLEIESAPGSGTLLTADLPLRMRVADHEQRAAR